MSCSLNNKASCFIAPTVHHNLQHLVGLCQVQDKLNLAKDHMMLLLPCTADAVIPAASVQ